ncbi:MAG: hypothetical protein WAS05_07975 [Candidatus Nanopelagicales bacterium]
MTRPTRTSTFSRKIISLGASLSLVAVGLVAVSVSPAAAAEASFSTPGSHTFDVPSGVTEITVEAIGGGGGGVSSVVGGSGCKVTNAAIDVSSLDEVEIFVGGDCSVTISWDYQQSRCDC